MNHSQETETTAPVEYSEQGGLYYARPASPYRALAARYLSNRDNRGCHEAILLF